MRLALQTYTVRDLMTDPAGVKSTLTAVRDIGFRLLHTGTPSFMAPADYKALLDDLGLSALSVSCPDPAPLMTQIDAIAAQAKLFNVQYADIGTLPSEFRNSAQGYQDYSAALNKAGKALYEACGVKPIYHNHALEFISLGDGLCGMDIMFDLIDPQYVAYVLDTHWLASGGKNPPDHIRKFTGRLPLMHFKDYAIDPDASFIEAVPRIFAEVGQGNLDWPAIMAACTDAGTKVCITEQDVCKRPALESARISYEAMIKLGLEA